MNLGDGIGEPRKSGRQPPMRCPTANAGPRILNGRDFMISSIHLLQRIAMWAHTSPQAGR